ncbi:MAG: hypothetical protein ACKO3P_09535, partial [Planctomycetaceae bacterium]
WRATPLASPGSAEFSWGCRVLEDPRQARSGRHCAALGFGWGTNAATADPAPGEIAHGARLTLTQEIRNPRAGEFEVAVWLAAGGDFATYRDLLALHFTARLVLFGYRDLAKNPLAGYREFASVAVDLDFDLGGEYRELRLKRRLRSQDDGANEIEMGVGLALELTKSSPGTLQVPAGRACWLCVDDFELRFLPRPRNDTVRV